MTVRINKSVAWNANLRIYPCANCGKMRSKIEGGTTFTVCDECWDSYFKLKSRNGENGDGK
jgi:DNA-directed RNA polymerase subunit RPC12/RpoP